MLFPFLILNKSLSQKKILNKSFSPLYQCTLSANLRIKFLYSFSKKKKNVLIMVALKKEDVLILVP